MLEFKLSRAVPGFAKSAARPCPSFCESLADDFVTVPDEVGEGLAFQHAVGEQRKTGDLVQERVFFGEFFKDVLAPAAKFCHALSASLSSSVEL